MTGAGGSTTSSVILRSPSPGDLAGFAEFLAELGYPASPEAVERRLARLTESPDVLVLAAESSAEPVGLVTAHLVQVIHVDEPVAMLTALVVSDRHRGRGVGRLLVDAVENWAQHRGARRVSITTGLAREGAHAFYERLGYQHTGRRYLKQV